MKAIKKQPIVFVTLMLIFVFYGLYTADATSAGDKNNCNTVTSGDKITDSCTWNGIPLYGKVKFVEAFPDIKIQIVNSFPGKPY